MDEWGRDEAELVRRCREGSEAAYAALVRQHRPRLYALAYRLLLNREAAEDVVQETFLSAFQQIERFEPRPSLAAWLNTIALRTAGRAAARQRARPKTSIDAPVSRTADRVAQRAAGQAANWNGDALALADPNPAADPHAAVEAADLRRDVAVAIAALPFKYRAAVVLRHVMGLDYAEAARALDIPLNTFKSHLLRGTKQLREALAGAANVSSAAAVAPTVGAGHEARAGALEGPAVGVGPTTGAAIAPTTGAAIAPTNSPAAVGPTTAGGDGPHRRHPGEPRTVAERQAAERTAGG